MRLLIVTLLVVACRAMDIPKSFPDNVPSTVVTTTTETADTLELACLTGKSIPGICVKRERCDHATTAIDLTLYRPRGYKQVCTPGDVCCPHEFLVQADNKIDVPEKGGFDFDDED